MKKLINFGGGRGYYVDDVEVLQDQLEGLKLVFAEFGGRAFIVHGCQVTAGSQAGRLNISPGLAYVGGVMVSVLGATDFDTGGSGTAYIHDVLDTGFAGHPAEFRYYDLEDATKKAFEWRHGRITATAPAAGVPRIVLAADAFQRVTWLDYLKLLLTNEETKVFFTDWQFAGQQVQYRKDFQGRVRLQGQLVRTDNGAALTTVTLPPGFTSATHHTFYVNGGRNGSNGNRDAARYGVKVDPNGSVGVVVVDFPETAPTGNFWCPLDGLYFRASS